LRARSRPSGPRPDARRRWPCSWPRAVRSQPGRVAPVASEITGIPGSGSGGAGLPADDGLSDGVTPDSGISTSVRVVVGRAALVIVGATLVGRSLGLVRDIVVAYFFGAQAQTDAFFLGYKVPYLLTLMVSGALTATFVPLFSYRLATGRKKEAWDLSVNIGNIIALILVAVSVLLVAIAPWFIPLIGPGLDDETTAQGVFLFRILMIGFVFEGLTGLVVGMLNSLRRFALAAFAPAVGTVVTLAVTVAFAARLGITALAVGSVAGWVAGLVVLFPGLRGEGIRYRPRIDLRDPGVREVGGMVWPILIGSAVGKVSVFIIQLLGSYLEEGAISSLNYADKLFQLPLGLFVAGITVPIFPLLSEQVATKAPERVKATLDFALRLMGFLLVPATVGIILLRYPLIGLLLEHGEFTAADTKRTAWALLFLCLGLYAYRARHAHPGLLRLSRHAHAGEDQRCHGRPHHRSRLSLHAVPGSRRSDPGDDRGSGGQLRGAHVVAAAQDRGDRPEADGRLPFAGDGGFGGHGGGGLGGRSRPLSRRDEWPGGWWSAL